MHGNFIAGINSLYSQLQGGYGNIWSAWKKMFFFCPLCCLSFFDLCLYQVRVITVFPVFRLLTDFVCLYTYEFWLSLCKIVRSSVILLLPLFSNYSFGIFKLFLIWNICIFLNRSTLYGSLSIQHVYASPNFH
jgi:hypothetical protein